MTSFARTWLPLLASLTLATALNRWALDYPARWDLTDAGVYSMSPQTRAVLARLRVPVEVTFFHDLRSRAQQDARYLLEQYAAETSHLEVRSFDPVLQPAAAARFEVAFAGTAVFESAGRRVTVSTPGEVAFTNALIRVSSAAIGRVCFTDGHVESNPMSLQSHDHFEQGGAGHGHDHASGGRPLTLHERHGMGMARNALEVLGYTVEQRKLVQGPDALAGCSVVVVASPQAPFAPAEAAQLGNWLDAGKPALFLLEPAVDSGLAPLLARYGVALGGAVRDPGSHYWTDPATPAVSDYRRHRITRQLAMSFFPGAAELVPSATGVPPGIVITPLAETSADARPAERPDAEPGRRTLMLEATRAPQETGQPGLRLIVAGDGDFATNSFFGALGNGQLFTNAVAHLAEHDTLVDISPREYSVGRLSLSNAQLRMTFLLTTAVGPLALLAFGAWVWWRRRTA
jgi:ABC-type uncharacterized transport system involved in gliding motility auxiliary subunit